MGLFDWIPTIEEGVEFVGCRLLGHSWVRAENGQVYCKDCGKKK